MPARPLHLVALSLTLVGLACGFLGDQVSEQISQTVAEKATEEAIEHDQGGDANVNLQEGNFSLKTDKGSFSVQSGSTLPAGFPSDIPLYPGATVTSSAASQTPEGAGFLVTADSTDTPDKIIAFYKDKLASGFQSKADMNMNGQLMLVYQSADEKRSVQLTATPQGTGSQMSLTVSSK